jgi:hypothetical protein
MRPEIFSHCKFFLLVENSFFFKISNHLYGVDLLFKSKKLHFSKVFVHSDDSKLMQLTQKGDGSSGAQHSLADSPRFVVVSCRSPSV